MPHKSLKTRLQRFICGALINVILFTQVLSAGIAHAAVNPSVDPADAPNNIERVYDLITIVVDEGILKSNVKGLDGQISSMESRIERYQTDLLEDNELTDTKILYFDGESESVADIANSLENLYLNGASARNRLVGAVFVGNIPLPVVNKKGNSFVSMYPYTDFEDKSYIYNSETKIFESNPDVSFPQPEIWHGVIRGTKNGMAGIEEIAQYFDKNHAYHTGDPEYGSFEKKLFYADLIHEEERMNDDMFAFYNKYLESWEDTAYMRYNKHWANELVQTINAEMEEDDVGFVEESDIPQVQEFLDALPGGEIPDIKSNVPDIYAKNIIEQYLFPYYRVFPKFLSEINDFADATGRYMKGPDGRVRVHSTPVLISIKDEATKGYLRAVNDALEKKVNEIADTIAADLPLLKYSKLSLYEVDDDGNEEKKGEDVYMRYHYDNTGDGAGFYINGINSDILSGAKQCSAFLGSTDSEYFTEGAFNPKAVDGDYSILTRSTRVDDFSTASPKPTMGINTRLLSASDANDLSNNKASNGALIEDNLEYGMPAFIHNSVVDDGTNSFEQAGLAKGDIITAVDGNPINSSFTLDMATQFAYESVVGMMKMITEEKTDSEGGKHGHYSALERQQVAAALGADISFHGGKTWESDSLDKAEGIISVSYYDKSANNIVNKRFKFYVKDDDGYWMDDGDGGLDMTVDLGTGAGGATFPSIFLAYDTKDGGFDNKGYDSSAGCNRNSAGINSDRCFPLFATMPVLSPAGSHEPILQSFPPNTAAKWMFPEYVMKNDQGANSGDASIYEDRQTVFQFPSNREFEEVDEVIYDACYFGLPSDGTENYGYVIKDKQGDAELDEDGDDPYEDYVHNASYAFNEGKKAEPPGEGDDSRAYWSPSTEIETEIGSWFNIYDINAYSVGFKELSALGELEDVGVTLADFAEAYGMFDGEDNNGNGVADYEWEDVKRANGQDGTDGIVETRWYDHEEGDSDYGIAPENLGEVSRKMLSQDNEYFLHSAVSGLDHHYLLKVEIEDDAKVKDISSVILHNEPTPYTISQQLQALSAQSLPIDNPRYVSFRSQAPRVGSYPFNKNNPSNNFSDIYGIDPDDYVDDLDKTVPYSPYGESVKVVYPNVYDTENYHQLLNEELPVVAADLTHSVGSYKVLSNNYVDCRGVISENPACMQIYTKIYNDLKNVVKGATDSPQQWAETTDLNIAAEEKIADALEWQSFNIDEKHKYILERYLSDELNSFVDDPSLLPAPGGYEVGLGYEAAYLVLDGERNYFNMNFNKDLPTEGDPAFDPLEAMIAENAAQEENGVEEDNNGVGNTSDDGGFDYQFVDLAQFFKELQEFISAFTTVPKFEQSCGFIDLGDESSEPVASLSLEVSSNKFSAHSEEKLVVTIKTLDENGLLTSATPGENGLINLKVKQSDTSPAFSLLDSSDKAPYNGVVTYTLYLTGEAGQAIVSASTDNGVGSNVEIITVTNAGISLNSYINFEVEEVEQPEAEEDPVADDQEPPAEEDPVADDQEPPAEDKTSEEDATPEEEELISDLEEILEETGRAEEDDSEETVKPEEEDVEEAPEEIVPEEPEENTKPIKEEEVDSEETVEPEEEEDPNIIILQSHDSDEEGEGDGVQEKIPRGGSDGNAEATGDGTRGEGDGSSELGDDSESEVDVMQEWEEYFFVNDYYKKYIDPDYEALIQSSRLVAEVISDRLLSYLPDNQNPFVLYEEKGIESGYSVESGDYIVADGESLMKIEATIFGNDGSVAWQDKNQVRFSVESNVPNIIKFENGSVSGNSTVVSSEEGIATVYLRAGTKTGIFSIRAEVLNDEAFAPMYGEYSLVAGEPVSLEVTADTGVLVSNSQSKANLSVILRDKFNNIANNSFAKVAIFADSKIELPEGTDEDSELIGTQMSTFEGVATTEVLSKDENGEASVFALLLDSELEDKFRESGDKWQEDENFFVNHIVDSKKFSIVDNVSLQLTPKKESISANGNDVVGIEVRLNGGNKYSGPVKVESLNENMGKFVKEPETKMKNGRIENIQFKADTLAGEAEILVEVPGFTSNTIKIPVLPLPAVRIEVTSSDDEIYTNQANSVVLSANLYDKYDNLATNNSTTVVTFAASDATKDFVSFKGANSAKALKGVASIEAVGEDLSGVANISATAPNLETGRISLKVTKHVDQKAVKEMSPRALYMSVLGGSFGDFASKDNLAQTFLFSGKTQAVSAITASPDDHKRLFGVDAYGKITVMSDTVEAKLIPATSSLPYQKVLFSDSIDDTELASVYYVPKADSEVTLLGDGESVDEEGIFVQPVGTSEKVELTKEGNGIYLKQDGTTLVKVDEYGRIFVNDDRYESRLVNEDDEINVSEFAVQISGKEASFVVRYNLDFEKDVKEREYGKKGPFAPGIYIQPNNPSNRYQLISGFTRASTEENLGAYLTDTDFDIDLQHAPGFPQESLEDARRTIGVGFEGDNKSILFFAAGNSVGEANIPYASETGIVFGDPTIRLEVEGEEDLVSELSGYTKDIGKPLFSGEDKIQQLIDFDYNGDGQDDLLLLYENGLVRLLEREESNRKFRDRKYILNISNGIYSATKLDVNNDGYDDLLVGTKDACHEGEKCSSLFTNYNGHFVRETVNLGINGKMYDVKSGDVNADGCDDVVTSDAGGYIRVFYNKIIDGACSGLDTNYGESNSFSFGYSIDGDKNLKNNLFIYHSDLPAKFEGTPQLNYEDSNTDKFLTVVLPVSEPPALAGLEPEEAAVLGDAAALQNSLITSENIAGSDIPPQSFDKEFDFLHLPEANSKFSTTTKIAKDLNGGTVSTGDEIEYVVTLKNGSNKSYSNVMLSDFIAANMSLDLESLECLDAECPDQLEWLDTGTVLRSHVISGISVPANGVRTLRYVMTANKTPEINFDLGNSFVTYENNQGVAVSDSIQNDDYLDILVRPSVNPDGVLTYIYSLNDTTAKGHVKFAKMSVASNAGSKGEQIDDAFNNLGIPSPSDLLGFESPFGPTPDQEQGLTDLTNKLYQDSDYNGCADSWGGVSGAMAGVEGAIGAAQDFLKDTAGAIENVAGMLRCGGGGCLPIPYNRVFLAPDNGVPGTAVMGLISSIPFIMPVTTYAPPSYFRLYMSPTLTMGLGISPCIGTYPGSVCYAFALPLSAIGACPDFLGPINDAVAAASESTSNTDVGSQTVISDGEAGAGSGAYGDNFAYSDPDSPLAAAGSVNIKIPGFPAVITNWFDKQIDEVYNKLTDLPEIYFIYPDFSAATEGSFAGFDDIKSMNDILRAFNSIPFIQIEGKEVLLKIPAISRNEYVKWKRQADAWVEFHKAEVDKLEEYWTCDENPDRRTLCDSVTADMKDLIKSVQDFMNLVDEISNLPRKILSWRTAEAKYATQIICYLDTIMQFLGGYMKKQQIVIESWMKAIEDIIKTFKDWKMILDLVIEYKTSCDQCKNDRFSMLGLLMQFFAAIPEPPIIPLPKMPDIVFDVSQIKTGTKIIWPDLIFKPQPIKLPNLPYIRFPQIMPELEVKIPGFGLPDIPSFKIPELPDLPPLPIPQLPDLPRPPKIPGLPDVVVDLLANLKIVFKILCLLKGALVPVPESNLGTEIETLTQPSVQIVLPIIAKLGVQLPGVSYSYWEKIKITAKLDFGIDVSTIYLAARYVSEKSNDAVKEIVDLVNEYTQFPVQQIIDGAVAAAEKYAQEQIEQAAEAAAKAAQEAAEQALKDVTPGGEGNAPNPEEDSPDPEDEVSGDLEALNGLRDNLLSINQELEDYVASLDDYSSYPDKHYLVATQTYMDPSHPSLNRTLAEVERDINNSDVDDLPGMERLVALRDSLIDYTHNLNDTNALLENIDEIDETFTNILVDNDESLDRIASLTMPTPSGDVTKEITTSFYDEATLEKIESEINTTDSLLAFAGGVDPLELIQDSGSEPEAAPKGFYVVIGDQNESVLGYTKELGQTVHTLFMDVDEDEDYDIVYSMGGNVYLKENYTNNEDMPHGDAEAASSILSALESGVSDYVNAGGASVQGVASSYVNNDKAEITWKRFPGDIAGYEVVLRLSLLHDYDDATETYYVPIEDLLNPEAPSLALELDNGNYYATVWAIGADGERSLTSETAIVAPQSCADDDAPFPAVQSEYEVAIFKELEIDASGSFDPSGTIEDYYIETTNKTDAGEKALTPLPDKVQPYEDPGKFKIGPFTLPGDPGIHTAIMHVVDQSTHSSAQEMNINVFVPEITLDQNFATTAVATGTTKPEVSSIPFILMRSRYIYRVVYGALKMIPRREPVITKSANTLGRYLTDADGSYEIDDFNLEDMILVEVEDVEENKDIIAEIHPVTGDIGQVDEGYSTVVNDAVPPTSPTSVDIVDDNGRVLGTVYPVSDPNADIKVHEEVGFDSENYIGLKGVNVSDMDAEDSFVVNEFPADDKTYPGGVALVYENENKQMVVIDTAGNIILLDKRMGLRQKVNDHEIDPLVIEVLFSRKVVAEVYIAPTDSGVHIVGPNDVPFMTPRAPAASTFYGDNDPNAGDFFVDGNEDLNRKAEELKNRGLDLFENGWEDLKTDEAVKRSEFVKALLDMLCIIPRDPEAYAPYSPDEGQGGFSDLKYSETDLAWYYPYVKEANLLDLIEGYKGETDDNGLHPFRADFTITRAEATKIILEALELKGVVDLSGLNEGEPWYEPFMIAAQDLTPYAKGSLIKNNFIVTAEEAKNPNEEMTREQLVEMAMRVLDFYDCFEIDTDENGLSDYCEEKYGVSDPQGDEDNDNAINLVECEYGLNPRDKDTDKGGMLDGDELKHGTDPLNTIDDPIDSDGDGLTNKAEELIHGTDPFNPDTDGGGVNDGDEVKNLTNPIDFEEDDGEVNDYKEGESGLYIVPPECNVCPCPSTFLHKADVMPGDTFFSAIITNPSDPKFMFTKSEDIIVEETPK